MQKKISIFLIVALVVGGASFFYFQNNAVEDSAKVGTEVGMQAPDFTLKNILISSGF